MTDLAGVHTAIANQVRNRIARDFTVAAWPFSHSALPKIEVWPDEDYVNYYGLSDSDFAVAPVQVRLRIEISTQDGE